MFHNIKIHNFNLYFYSKINENIVKRDHLYLQLLSALQRFIANFSSLFWF